MQYTYFWKSDLLCASTNTLALRMMSKHSEGKTISP